MLLCTGLGSNSLTGSPKLAPLGKRPTLTVAVSDFLEHATDGIGPLESSLLLLSCPAGQLELLLSKGGVRGGLVNILANRGLRQFQLRVFGDHFL